jgi:putative two-component system response regulator
VNTSQTKSANRQTVLIVDDTPENLAVITALLTDTYRTRVANNGERALKMANSDPVPDLILLDIMMPGIDGYEVCRRLKDDPATADIPVLFLTAKTLIEDEQMAFDVGAADYITKPISPSIVIARVRTHLENKLARDIIKRQQELIESEVAKRIPEVKAERDVAVAALAGLADSCSGNPITHRVLRMQHYLGALAQTLRLSPRFAALLTEDTLALLCKAAPLYSIGESAEAADWVGDVAADRTALAHVARSTIIAAEKHLGATNRLLGYAREAMCSHTEDWIGGGYPQGLSGDAIPVVARMVALADTYDRLVSDSADDPAASHRQAIKAIVAGRATRFDPDMVDAFVITAGNFLETARRFGKEQIAELPPVSLPLLP